MGRGYHFTQRISRHRELLEGREKELRKVLEKALKGVARKPRVHVHPTHFHVFAGVEESRKPLLVFRIKEGIGRLEGITWDAEYSLVPVASLKEEYVGRLLKELHSPAGAYALPGRRR